MDFPPDFVSVALPDRMQGRRVAALAWRIIVDMADEEELDAEERRKRIKNVRHYYDGYAISVGNSPYNASKDLCVCQSPTQPWLMDMTDYEEVFIVNLNWGRQGASHTDGPKRFDDARQMLEEFSSRLLESARMALKTKQYPFMEDP